MDTTKINELSIQLQLLSCYNATQPIPFNTVLDIRERIASVAQQISDMNPPLSSHLIDLKNTLFTEMPYQRVYIRLYMVKRLRLWSLSRDKFSLQIKQMIGGCVIYCTLKSKEFLKNCIVSTALAFADDTGIRIQITPPTGWTNRDANVAIIITDHARKGFMRTMVKGEGNWRDITAVLEQEESRYNGVLSVSDNCTVTVTGWDGQTYEESRYIDCFDREAPTLRTSFTDKHLHVEATDTASGVAAVYVGGKNILR